MCPGDMPYLFPWVMDSLFEAEMMQNTSSLGFVLFCFVFFFFQGKKLKWLPLALVSM